MNHMDLRSVINNRALVNVRQQIGFQVNWRVRDQVIAQVANQIGRHVENQIERKLKYKLVLGDMWMKAAF